MPQLSRSSTAAAALVVGVGLALAPRPIVARDSPTGDPPRVLWRDPGPIAERDLSWTSNADFGPPRPPFAFVKEDTSGTNPKVTVTDARGTEWNVKLSASSDDAAEVHAEVAAARLVWALGYFVDESYYVSEGTIEGLGNLKRADRAFEPDGHFRVARFEKRPVDQERLGDRWTFGSNPFVGSRELSGLKILMTMISNWDLGGTRNTRIVAVSRAGTVVELRYLVSDLGASFGRMGPTALIREWSKWNLLDFQQQKFIDDVRNGFVDLHYEGDGEIDQVPLDHARWFANLAAQLTPDQIKQAFESAGATPAEVDGYQQRVLEKIAELRAAVSLRSSPSAIREPIRRGRAVRVET